MTEPARKDVEHQPVIGGRLRGLVLRRRSLARPSIARRPLARRRGWDAFAALIAALVGFLALVVSAYTAYVQRKQLRAQIWPYVTINTGNVPPYVGFHAVNSGTGPARVIAVGVQVDRRFVRDWYHAEPAGATSTVRTIVSQLSNTVLPAGKDLMFFGPYDQASSESFVALFLEKQHEVRVTVCYCSVLDDCWTTSSDTVPAAIADAGACPIAVAERFKQ